MDGTLGRKPRGFVTFWGIDAVQILERRPSDLSLLDSDSLCFHVDLDGSFKAFSLPPLARDLLPSSFRRCVSSFARMASAQTLLPRLDRTPGTRRTVAFRSSRIVHPRNRGHRLASCEFEHPRRSPAQTVCDGPLRGTLCGSQCAPRCCPRDSSPCRPTSPGSPSTSWSADRLASLPCQLRSSSVSKVPTNFRSAPSPFTPTPESGSTRDSGFEPAVGRARPLPNRSSVAHARTNCTRRAPRTK